MSVEFRQRKPGELARMVWRRKWLIVLPTVAVAAGVAYGAWKVPNVYASPTLLTVRPPTIATPASRQLSDLPTAAAGPMRAVNDIHRLPRSGHRHRQIEKQHE